MGHSLQESHYAGGNSWNWLHPWFVDHGVLCLEGSGLRANGLVNQGSSWKRAAMVVRRAWRTK